MLLWKSHHLPAHAYPRKSSPLVLPDFLVINKNTLNVPKYCEVLKSFVPKVVPQSWKDPHMLNIEKNLKHVAKWSFESYNGQQILSMYANFLYMVIAIWH